MQDANPTWSLVDRKGEAVAALADRVFDMPKIASGERRSYEGIPRCCARKALEPTKPSPVSRPR